MYRILFLLCYVLSFSGFGQKNVVQYNFPSTGSTAQWVKLGRFSNALSNHGATVRIDINGHAGYNAANSQDYILSIFFKTSNGGAVNANGFGGNSWYYSVGNRPEGVAQVKWVASHPGVSATYFDLYLQLTTFTLNSNYTVYNFTGTWENLGLLNQQDPGEGDSTVLKSEKILHLGESSQLRAIKLQSLASDLSSNLTFQKFNSSERFTFTHTADNKMVISNTVGANLLSFSSAGGLTVGGVGAEDLGNLRVSGELSLGNKINSTNNWIFSTPDQNRSLFISPWNYAGSGATWDMNKGIELKEQGDLILRQNLGVGTSSPRKAIEIAGANGTGIRIFNTTANFWDIANNEFGKLDFIRGNQTVLRFDQDGNVGIGTLDTKGYKLAVNGPIISTKVKIKNPDNWPDYVFAPHYTLTDLYRVEEFIKKHGHLPEVPSASEVRENGQDLGEMNKLLLRKVEELTLYLLEEKKRGDKLEERLNVLETKK